MFNRINKSVIFNNARQISTSVVDCINLVQSNPLYLYGSLSSVGAVFGCGQSITKGYSLKD